MKTNLVQAFGEYKTIIEWSRDDRCKINRGMIRYRINHERSPEKAISIPPLKKNRWFGEPE